MFICFGCNVKWFYLSLRFWREVSLTLTVTFRDMGVIWRWKCTQYVDKSIYWSHSSYMTFLSQMTKATCWTRWEQSRRTQMWTVLLGFSSASTISGHILSITLHLTRYLFPRGYICTHWNFDLYYSQSKKILMCLQISHMEKNGDAAIATKEEVRLSTPHILQLSHSWSWRKTSCWPHICMNMFSL